jgi:hypothetical protein
MLRTVITVLSYCGYQFLRDKICSYDADAQRVSTQCKFKACPHKLFYSHVTPLLMSVPRFLGHPDNKITCFKVSQLFQPRHCNQGALGTHVFFSRLFGMFDFDTIFCTFLVSVARFVVGVAPLWRQACFTFRVNHCLTLYIRALHFFKTTALLPQVWRSHQSA